MWDFYYQFSFILNLVADHFKKQFQGSSMTAFERFTTNSNEMISM